MSVPWFIILAVLAAFFLSLSNIIDKAVLTDFVTDPLVVTFFTSVFGTLFSLFLIPTGLVKVPSLFVGAISFLLGVLYILPLYLYMKGLQMEEASRAIPIFSLVPVFVAILGAFFLNEVFNLTTYAGIILAVTGSVMVSSKRFGLEFFNIKANKAFWTIIGSTVLFAVYSVGTKWVLSYDSFWNIFFWSRIGTMLPTLLVLAYRPVRLQIIGYLQSIKESKLEFLGVSEFWNNLAVLTQTAALSLGPAALVETAYSTQSIFVLLLVLALGKFSNKNLGDDLSRKALAIKFISSIMIITGIYLIS